MRSLVFLSLLGLALSASQWQTESRVTENRFRQGREYHYRFDGQLSLGIPVPNSQQAATRVLTLAKMQPEADRYVRMQLTETRFATVQNEVEPRKMLSIEQLETVRIEKEHERLLSLPVRFSYRHGMVGDIEFSPEEQAWSANIKRAVINMMQVNMIKQGVSEKNQETENTNDYFVSIERTIEGECEVAYTQLEQSKQVQQWTKSVNFEKCSVRPEVHYGRRSVEKCEQCEKTLSNEKLSSTVLSFNITTAEKEEFLIREVELKSQHLFAPISEQQQLVAAYVINKMQLVYAGEPETKIETVRGERKESLIYNPEAELAEEKFAMTGDEKFLRRLPAWNNKVELVEKTLNKIAKHIESGIELETSHMLARLVKVLRLTTEEELTKMSRNLFENDKMEQKTVEKLRAIYTDALALAGTKVTITHLLEKISNKQVSPIKAAQLMKVLAEVRVASEEIADELVRFCENDVCARNPVLRQSCWLTYGSVLNGLCGNNQEKLAVEFETKKVCPKPLKEKLVRKLVEKLEQSETRYEKVLIIKALANAAIDTSVFDLEKIIVDKKNEKVVRVQAIEALRRLRNVMPRKIQSVLMPVYKNRMELPELRMAALHIILQTQPEQALISQLVQSIETERSQQVRAFTYSSLRTLAQSTVECEEKLAVRVAKALNTIPEQQRQLWQSRSQYWTLYNNQYQTGASFNWAALFSNDSILPKELVASVDSVFAGQWNKYFAQIGFAQNNLDVLLTQVLRKVEQSGLEQLVVRGKRSAVFSPTELLRSLVQKLRISRREVSKEEPHAMLYLRYKDMDYAFLPIDIDTVPEMIKSIVREGKIELGDLERVLATGTHFNLIGSAFFHETTRKMPTALGLPIVLGSKMPSVASIQGHIKADFEPKNSDRFEGLRLRLVAQPQVAATHVVKVEIVSPIANVGIKLLHAAKIHTPVDTEITINWEKKLVVKAVVKAPETKKHIVHLMSRPLTYVRVWKHEMRQYPEAVEQTIYLKESRFPIHHMEREYFEDAGLKMVVSGHIRRPFFALSAEQPKTVLIGDNVIDVVIEPTTETREYVIRMEVEAFEPVERMEKPSFESFFEKSSKDNFEVEQNDYQTEDETERRQQFAKYYKNFEIVKAYKHRIAFKVETVGDRKTKEAKLELRAICDDKIRYCRLHVESSRSPMAEETRQWELKALIQTLYPEMPKSMKDLSAQLHREFSAIVEAHWGSEEKNNLNLKVQGEQSRDQKKWMQRVERQQNQLTETEKLVEASKLNLYKLVAEYKLAPETKFQLQKAFSMLKVWKMWSADFETVEKSENRVEAQLTIEPESRRLFNLTIQTPQERMTLQNVQMPFQLPTVNIRRSIGSVHSMNHAAEKLEKQTRPECIVKSNQIETFDEVIYKAPITSCYSVLAKDCSSEQPKFAVLMKKVSKKAEEKKIKIVSRENVIELEKTESEMIVKVDGKQVEDEQKMAKFGITKKSEEVYKIDIEHVSVHFDGYQAQIKMSPLYKNKQCGVCGHFDGERNNEFRRADNEETSDIEEFHRSFLSEDDECQKDESELSKKSNYKVLSEENSSSEEYDDERKSTKPVLRTRVIERGQRVCFSVNPVAECPRETREEETRSQETAFKCLRRSEPLVQRLLRLARSQVIPAKHIEEIEDTHEQNIRVPTACTVY